MRRRRPMILTVSTSVLATRLAGIPAFGPPRRKASRSSWPIRPAGPVPRTWRRSTPASRARRRTAGEAIGFSPGGRGGPSGARRDRRREAQADSRGFRRRLAGAATAGWAGRRRRRFARSRRHFLVAFARDLQADQLGADRQDAAHLAAQRHDGPGDRRRDLHGRLVGHDGGQKLVLQHRLADLDMPFDDLGLGDALADIGKLDDAGSHLRPPSRP